MKKMKGSMLPEAFEAYQKLMQQWFNGKLSKFSFEFQLHNLLGYKLL